MGASACTAGQIVVRGRAALPFGSQATSSISQNGFGPARAGLCSLAGVGAGGEGDGALDASGNTSWAVRGGCGGGFGVTRPLATIQRT